MTTSAASIDFFAPLCCCSSPPPLPVPPAGVDTLKAEVRPAGELVLAFELPKAELGAAVVAAAEGESLGAQNTIANTDCATGMVRGCVFRVIGVARTFFKELGTTGIEQPLTHTEVRRCYGSSS